LAPGHLDDARLLEGTGHARHRGAIDIGVEQADASARLIKRGRQIDGYGRLADTALSAGHRDRLPRTREQIGRLLAHDTCPYVRRHLDVDHAHTRESADDLLGPRLELIPDGAGGRGELEREADVTRGGDTEVLDHAQADDVPTEVGVDDLRQRAKHLLFGQWHVGATLPLFALFGRPNSCSNKRGFSLPFSAPLC
jgi:hypothetical protein